MSEVKDYRLTIRVRNNRLLRRIEATRGFVSLPKWCAKHGFSYTAVTDLIAMKVSPLRVNGDWRDFVERLASMLRSDPADLFPPRQRTGEVTAKNTVEREVNETELLALTEPAALAMIEDHTPERETIDRDLAEKLLSVLPPRERLVVEAYYGLGAGGGAAGSFEAAAQEAGIPSRERARQLLNKAQRRMLEAAYRRLHVISGTQFHKVVAQKMAEERERRREDLWRLSEEDVE